VVAVQVLLALLQVMVAVVTAVLVLLHLFLDHQ